MKRPAPVLSDVRHTKLCYSKHTYCGHPRQTGIFNYGNGELLVGHSHAPSRYQVPEDIGHSFTNGYASRARIIFQRSYDHGETWSAEEPAVVWDESLPLEEKRAILYRADEPAVPREQIDLTSPDAAVYFTRAATGPTQGSERGRKQSVAGVLCVPLRRPRPHLGDRAYPRRAAYRAQRGSPGRTSPRAVPRRHLARRHHRGRQLPDQQRVHLRLGRPRLDVGVPVGSDPRPTGIGTPGYADLLLLPNGRLQCYMLHGQHSNVIEMCHSDDGATAGATAAPSSAGATPRGLPGALPAPTGAASTIALPGPCASATGALSCCSAGASRRSGWA